MMLYYKTPMMMAVRSKRSDAAETIQLLLVYGAKLFRNALQVAITDFPNLSVVNKLLTVAADTDYEFNEPDAYDNPKVIQVISWWRMSMSQLNASLINAVKTGNLEATTLLLDLGADIEHTDKQGRTALINAARSAKASQMIAVLVTNGANINHQDAYGRTALMNAMYHRWGHSADVIISLLISYGADLNLADQYGRTVLFYAATYDPEMIRFLVKSGAHVNHTDHDGNTTWMLAAAGGRNDCTRALIGCGAKRAPKSVFKKPKKEYMSYMC